MKNLKNLQITKQGIEVLDVDDKVKYSDLMNIFMSDCDENTEIISYEGQKKFIRYKGSTGDEIILIRRITYLGNPHPLDKKRIQMPKWFQELYLDKRPYVNKIRLFGIYVYHNNVIYVEFDSDDYLLNTINNSSAHVSINDLKESYSSKVYNKIDKNNNIIKIINRIYLKEYLNNK